MKFIKNMIKGLFLVLVVSGIVSCSYVGWNGYHMYRTAIEQEPLEEKIQTVREKEQYTTIDKLPQMYLDAIVAVEDHRFYSHPGVDVLAIGRAVFNDLKSMSLLQGGSGITQQLAKNLYFSQKKEFSRKVAEIFLAFDIERTLTKEQILELYVNCIYFGDQYYCVYDASMGYFHKPPKNMNDYECTMLAGIPNAPSVYAPTANMQLAKQRQKQVLEQMVKYQYLSKNQVVTILAMKHS